MTSVDPSLSVDARPHFILALRRVLRPIVRLMIRYGIRYDEFAEVARAAYIESAPQAGVFAAQNLTLEQLEWATGISRAQIQHCIEAADQPLELAPILGSSRIMTEVLHRWHTSPKYLDSDGLPRELEFDSTADDPTFTRIVAEIDVDVDAKAVLDGLFDAKCVTYVDENRIKVLTRTLIWSQGGPRSIDYLGINLSRMIETLEYNLTSKDSSRKRLERSVFADRSIPNDIASEFHAFATERATQFLYDLDDWLARHEPPRGETGECPSQVGINLFFYVEPPADTRPISALIQPSRMLAADRDEAST